MSINWYDREGKYINRQEVMEKLQALFNSTFATGALGLKCWEVAECMQVIAEAPNAPDAVVFQALHREGAPYAPYRVPVLEPNLDWDAVPSKPYDVYELNPLRVRVSTPEKTCGGSLYLAQGALLAIEPALIDATTDFIHRLTKYGFQNFVEKKDGE